MSKIIIGTDTSFDDTSIGIIKVTDSVEVLADVRFTQMTDSLKFGGVVPEIAARIHLDQIEIILKKALKLANITMADIDYYAATVGPGLIGGVIIGSNFMKTLAKVNHKPFIPIHHIEGHISVANDSKLNLDTDLSLIISGGHSMIINNKTYQIICNTADDSAGELFDKIGRMMDLPFPAGPHVEKLALQGTNSIKPIKITPGELKFSFSGLKTKCLDLLKKEKKEDVCYFLQQSVVDHINEKIKLSMEKTGSQSISICGGVAANQFIRNNLDPRYNYKFPDPKLCTDNGVMIAIAAAFRLEKKLGIDSYIEEFSYQSLADFMKTL